jgi:putative membrane protein
MGPDWVARNGLAPWSSAGSAGFEFLMPLIWLVLLGVLLVGVVYLLGTGRSGTDSGRAEMVLRERYARGEITDEEFEHRTARLSDGGNRRASS